MDGADPRLTGLAIEIAVGSSDSPQRVELLRELATALPDLLALLNPLPVEARGPNKTEQ